MVETRAEWQELLKRRSARRRVVNFWFSLALGDERWERSLVGEVPQRKPSATIAAVVGCGSRGQVVMLCARFSINSASG